MNRFLLALLLVVLAGCSPRPALERPSSGYPVDPGFEGRWYRAWSEVQDSMPASPVNIVLSRDDARRVAGQDKTPGRLARAFLETGERLRITELDSALLISFDRAVVEEYRYGELRRVNIGPVVAQRSTGWEGDALVIRTLDDDRALMIERWWLADDGETLRRSVSIERGKQELLALDEGYRPVAP